MAWRVAQSLLKLRAQIDAAAPGRSKLSDGTVGDADHASRSSDHNPWVTDGGMGIVTAMDITHDPRNGVDAAVLAEDLRQSRDPRLKYIISNRRIASHDKADWAWRPYGGSNPHDKHVHISVKPIKALYDSVATWRLADQKPVEAAPSVVDHPLLRQGATGADVSTLQQMLGVPKDGVFGPKTAAAVREFQKARGLASDGIVGAYTWAELEKQSKQGEVS